MPIQEFAIRGYKGGGLDSTASGAWLGKTNL